jgi:Ca2+-binding RTX toxin-like protein
MRRSLLILLASATASTMFAGASTAQSSRAHERSSVRVMAAVRATTSSAVLARAAFARSRAEARLDRAAGRAWIGRWAAAVSGPSNVIREHQMRGAGARLLQAGPPPQCGGWRATIVGTNGNDTLTGTLGRDVIVALGGDDIVYGGGQNDVICAGDGNDTVWGGAGADKIFGEGGSDLLDGGAGNDTMDGGGQQFDAAAFFDETGPVTASLVTGTATGDGSDSFTRVRQLHGGNFADTFTGDANDNGLFGNGGNDTLDGGAGNDNLSGSSGDDTIDGGSGTFDSISFWDASGGVTASLTDGTSNGGGEGTDTFKGVEALYGGPGDDTLSGDASDNWLQGQGGDDTLSGGPGNDVLGPGAGTDTLDGGPGDADQAAYWDAGGPITANLASGASGDGNDSYSNIEQLQGSQFDDTLTAGPTDGWVFGNDGSDTITGGSGNDFLFGNAGNDTINGAGGNDFLAPGSGTDALDGGDGFDKAAYWDAAGAISADLALGTASGDGADSYTNLEGIHGGNLGDTLTGDAGNNELFGNDGNDVLDGAAGDDSLNGGNGDDSLHGGPGNDYLDGSDGSDSLDGGSDFDTCVSGETYAGCEWPFNVGRTNLALGKSVTASGEYPGGPPSLAVDGDWWSAWNSGNFPPQWIEVDLGAVASVGEIDLAVTQLPDSATIHRVYGRSDASSPYVLLREFSGFTSDQQVLRYFATGPLTLRFIRVETTSSASWVGWREIQVFAPGD